MRHKHSKSGFSLVVLSLLLAVASILIIFAMPSDSDKMTAAVKKTNVKLQKITDALNVYYEANSVVPCPAKFTVIQGVSGFGAANCTCGSGIICPSTSGMGNLLVGTVPVKNLGLTDDYAVDEWGRQITYAMDNSSPSATLTVKDLSGNLDVNARGSQPITFFFSHGPNGKGAYLRNGTLNSATCNGAAAGEDSVRSETENCDSTVAATADRNFIRSPWNSLATATYDDLSGEIYKKSWVGFKNNGYQWLLFQMEKSGVLTTLESATSISANNIWKNTFGAVNMGPVSCNLADNGKTVCVVVGDKYINSLLSGCALVTGGCSTYWVFTAKPDVGFINKSNGGGFNSIGNFTNFTTSLLGSKPKVKCWKAGATRFLCMAASTSYYKVFSIDTETGMNEISTVAPAYGAAYNGYNFWGSLLNFDVAGFDCAATGNSAADFICLAAGQGGSFQSFKLNEATGISNRSGMQCYGAYGAFGAIALVNGSSLCLDQLYGGQARDVSCNMVKGSTSQAACVAVYNKTLSGRAARLFIATTSALTPTFCPTPSTNTSNTCMVTPTTSAGDNLKAMDGTTQFTTSNMGDVLGLNCAANNNPADGKFNCFIGGLGTGLSAAGYIGLYNYSTTAFTTTAVQSSQPGGGVFAPSCSRVDEKKYYCLYSGTGTGSGCTTGNNCNYSVWNNYQTKLNSGTYTAWPVDTAWSYFAVAK